MLYDVINKLIELSSKTEFDGEILQANQEYFAKTGRVVEDEPTYETRMSLFLEWFLFERPLTKYGITPLSYFVQNHNGCFDEKEMEVMREIQTFQHSIYEFTRIKENMVHVRDLADRKKLQVFERRGTTGFLKGSIFEGRLVPYQGLWHFSGSLLFHPPRSKKWIRKFLRSDGGLNHLEKILKLSELCLKYERYKHVAPEKIYGLGLEPREESPQS